MPFKREAHFIRSHSAAVVGNLDSLSAATDKGNRDVRCAGVQRVFHKFFQGTCRTLDDLARGDAIDQFGGQPSY